MFRGATFVRCCGVDAKGHIFITGYAILISVDIKDKLRGEELGSPFLLRLSIHRFFKDPTVKNLLVDLLGVLKHIYCYYSVSARRFILTS